MKIYTKTGDDGKTSLYSGERIEKASLRVEAFGTLDELQAAVGLARASSKDQKVRAALKEVEQQLVLLMTEISSSRLKNYAIKETDVSEIEQKIDQFYLAEHEFLGFVLPGEDFGSATLHLARTIARRAERLIWKLSKKTTIEQPVLSYINRLSDFLFVLSQYELKSAKQNK